MGLEGYAKCAKWTLLVLMILFCLVGVGFIVMGALIYNAYTFLAGFTNAVPTGADVMMLVGIAIMVTSVVGLVGAVRENYCEIMAFAVLMAVIFILEIAAGVAGFVISQQVYTELQAIMNGTIGMYSSNMNMLGKTWDDTQSHFHCCGVLGPLDWVGSLGSNNSLSVPDSCCLQNSQGCGIGVLAQANYTSYIYMSGCLPSLENSIAHGALIIGITAIAFSLLELGSVVCACLVARAIQIEYKMI